MYKEDTIAAIATPPGEGAIGIVRVSGPDAERIAGKIFRRRDGRPVALRSHLLHHGRIVNPQNGEPLDEVLVALMRRPRSYTGEDVLEIHAHGSPQILREILGLVLTCGARQAEPGEFTKRAFLNGRLDLAQAEAVLDLIRSRTPAASRLALGQASGELSRWVSELREALLEILVHIEAAIDFPEEDLELMRRDELCHKIESLLCRVRALIRSYNWGRLFRDGARVAIIGRPNVGKSSLFNALLGQERVIVTPQPGTTRDVIEESIDLDGLPVVLWDTAGIRATQDRVERLGVELSMRALSEAEALLLVVDGSSRLQEEDWQILDLVKDKRRLLAVNKSDMELAVKLEELARLANGSPPLFVSAKTGLNLSELRASLRKLLLGTDSQPDLVLTNVRHRAALERAAEHLEHGLDSIRQGLAAEFAAADVQEAKNALEEIVGRIASDNILERIFAQFCIGK
jgi:tRNA modification GTPase